MKRLMYFGALAVAIAAIMVVIPACDEEDTPTNTGPTTGSVSGTVTFDGTWPSTGDVQVSIYSTLAPPYYVPMGPPDAFTDPIAGSPVTYDYSMTGLDFGTYAGIYVSWRDPTNPSNARLLGMYWVHIDSLGIVDDGSMLDGTPKPPYPATLTLNAGDAVHSGLDIRADLDLSQ